MYAVRAAKAFDGDRCWPDGATALIDDGAVVGIEALCDLPTDVTVHDFPGGTLLPGLVNMHVHLCGDSADGALERLPEFGAEDLGAVIDAALAEQLASGVTTVRDLGDDRWSVVARRDAPAADAAVPHIVASGPPITSVGGHCWMMGGETAGVPALRAAVRERAERRVDVVKVMASGGNMTPDTDVADCQFTLEELRAVVDESHACGLGVTAHAHALVAVEQAVAAGVDGIEHCTCITPDGYAMSDDLVDRLRERRIVVCPTLGKALDAVPPPRVQEMLRRTGLTLERRAAMVARAMTRGVSVVSGDDAGISAGKRHGVFAEAIIDLSAAGVDPAAALVTATSGAARALGLDARKGRIRAGADADLVVVDGDATRDLAALRSVALVVVGGRVVGDGAGAPR